MVQARALVRDDSQVESAAVSRIEILQKLRMIIRAATQHSARVRDRCGVNGAQLWIMQELQQTDGLRVGELADRLAIHQTTASNLVDGLVKRGHVAKMRDATDQRVVIVRLSKQGADVLKKAPAPARGLLPEALLQLDDAGAARLNDGLQGLIDSIEVLDEELAMLPLPFTM